MDKTAKLKQMPVEKQVGKKESYLVRDETKINAGKVFGGRGKGSGKELYSVLKKFFLILF